MLKLLMLKLCCKLVVSTFIHFFFLFLLQTLLQNFHLLGCHQPIKWRLSGVISPSSCLVEAFCTSSLGCYHLIKWQWWLISCSYWNTDVCILHMEGMWWDESLWWWLRRLWYVSHVGFFETNKQETPQNSTLQITKTATSTLESQKQMGTIKRPLGKPQPANTCKVR